MTKVVCPKCGREGYLTVKAVTGPSHFQIYYYRYVRHKKGRPKWCYIGPRIGVSGIDHDDWKVPNSVKEVPNQIQDLPFSCKDCTRHDIENCRIREYQFKVFGKKCPRE